MNLKSAFIAAALALGAITTTHADAQTSAADTAEIAPSIPAELQTSIKTALQRVSASPYANATLIEAVRARYDDAIRSLLIQNGVDANALATITIDANGPDTGPRKALPQTIYFAVSTTSSGSPLGLIYMGRPYGWVDWNTFDPWAYL
jgi:hypothetical protein